MSTRLTRGLLAALVGTVVAIGPASPALADGTRDEQWMIDALSLEEAWQTTKGEGITVGIVDTGVDATHPDIENNVLPGISVIGDTEGDNALTDPEGHGTAMASLIAGHGHGSGGEDGIMGVAPEAKVLSVRGTEYPKEGEWPTVGEPEQGIRWLADNGADVILLAYASGKSEGSAEHEAIQYAAIDHGIPVIAGAGNKETDFAVVSPASYSETLAVSGTTKTGEFWDGSVSGGEVSLSAPGADIIAAYNEPSYMTESGTSNSSAIVAGVMALLKAQYPEASRMELYWRITELAKDAGKEGPDDKFGYGIVDPVAALNEDPGPLPENMKDPEPDPDVAQDNDADEDKKTLTADTSDNSTALWVIAAVFIVLLITAAVILIVVRQNKRNLPISSAEIPTQAQTAAPPQGPTPNHSSWQDQSSNHHNET